MTTPTDTPSSSHIEHARHELWEGIESSRELVRQTRELIELTECGLPFAGHDDGGSSGM